MRRAVVLSVLLVALAVVVAGIGFSDDKAMPKAKAVTVEGTLIDCKCYAMDPANKGQDHNTPNGVVKNCAKACAVMGIPVGLLTDKGDVLVLIAPAESFSDHMTGTARVTGMKVYGGALLPDKVEVRGADGKWTQVSVTGMM